MKTSGEEEAREDGGYRQYIEDDGTVQDRTGGEDWRRGEHGRNKTFVLHRSRIIHSLVRSVVGF